MITVGMAILIVVSLVLLVPLTSPATGGAFRGYDDNRVTRGMEVLGSLRIRR